MLSAIAEPYTNATNRSADFTSYAAANNAEYLALLNSRRIRGDQMEFLRGQFSKNSRLLTLN